MGDREFLEAFEAATLPEPLFHHRDHVRLAWLYLRQLPPAAALARFSDGLRRYAASIGKAGLYHETITWAYLLLIHERMQRFGPEATFGDFAAAHPDLLSWRPSVLDGLYRKETLDSALARRTFLLPDRQPVASADSGSACGTGGRLGRMRPRSPA
jgi:hypothetical protein